MTKRDDFTPVAEQIPFDNSDNNFDAEDVQGAIEEFGTSASPGFGFGRSGTVSSGAWLLRSGGVPSNKTGVTIGISSPVLVGIDAGNEDVSTFDVAIYEHDGNNTNSTLLTTVSVTSARTQSFTSIDFGTVTATKGKQLAVKVTSGSAKNLGVDITLKGTA